MKTEKHMIDDLKKAESIGTIRSMPAMPEPEAVKAKTDKDLGVIDNPQDLQAAIGNAQMNGEEYIEVSDRMFKYLLKNHHSNYLTYGKPGIKIYRVGTREQMEQEDAMNAEAKGEYLARKKREALLAGS